jgi:hypothetical protein
MLLFVVFLTNGYEYNTSIFTLQVLFLKFIIFLECFF